MTRLSPAAASFDFDLHSTHHTRGPRHSTARGRRRFRARPTSASGHTHPDTLWGPVALSALAAPSLLRILALAQRALSRGSAAAAACAAPRDGGAVRCHEWHRRHPRPGFMRLALNTQTHPSHVQRDRPVESYKRPPAPLLTTPHRSAPSALLYLAFLPDLGLVVCVRNMV
jgi:hypothetical protein